jgi:hypothetical protein
MAAKAAVFQALKGVHELRFALCQTSVASAGTRCVWLSRRTWREELTLRFTFSTHSEFIETSYKALKAANPTLPVLIRECAGVEPRLTARFGALAFVVSSVCSPVAHIRLQNWEGRWLCRCLAWTRLPWPLSSRP